ncbi:amidase family protein [Vagococcus sp.]|uniref:amidase family protein n=1 Tax=Vagococcus sp. TaxID=1933889 RepID=UPI003F9C52AE
MKDAFGLAKQIKNKEISPIEILDELEKKIETHYELNAFVELNFEEARKMVEQATPEQREAPFFGVPFALKDLGQAKEGFKQTSGSRLFRNHRAPETNNYVKKIEAMGLIPFAVTTAPEFGFKNITDAVINGPTLNPWDMERFSGGSSGGAASIVAADIVPIAGASDGGGSIRIPASFSGLVGLKPSRGKIITGPAGWRDWQGASVNFILGKSIRDAKIILKGLKPDHQISPFSEPHSTFKKAEKYRIAACLDSPVGNKVSSEAQQAFREAIEFLVSLGHEVVEVPYPIKGRALIESYYQMNGGETAHMMQGISHMLQRPLTYRDMEPMSWALYQYGQQLSAADYSASFGAWDEATAVMEGLFTKFDLFLSPTATTVAPKVSDDLQSDIIRAKMKQASELNKEELKELVYEMFEKSLHITPYTQLANLTGQPAISLPTFVTDDFLPIGVQMMAAKGNDELLLEIGQLFELGNQFKILKKSKL